MPAFDSNISLEFDFSAAPAPTAAPGFDPGGLDAGFDPNGETLGPGTPLAMAPAEALAAAPAAPPAAPEEESEDEAEESPAKKRPSARTKGSGRSAGPRRGASSRRSAAAPPPAAGMNKGLLLGGVGAVVVVLVLLVVMFGASGGGGGKTKKTAQGDKTEPQDGSEPGGEKTGEEKTGGEKTGEEQTGAEKTGEEKTGSDPGPLVRKTRKAGGDVEGDPFKEEPGLTKEGREERASMAAERPLANAWELADGEKYDEAIELLSDLRKRWPNWLADTEALVDVKKKLAEYRRRATFSAQLEGALKEGPSSEKLKRWVKRVEGEGVPEDLKQLPVIARFKQRAEEVLGLEAYRKLEMETIDLGDVEKDLAPSGGDQE
ncbi:MAG: hypothetical protein AB7T09_19330 [Planctomycetota bacterium]